MSGASGQDSREAEAEDVEALQAALEAARTRAAIELANSLEHAQARRRALADFHHWNGMHARASERRLRIIDEMAELERRLARARRAKGEGEHG